MSFKPQFAILLGTALATGAIVYLVCQAIGLDNTGTEPVTGSLFIALIFAFPFALASTHFANFSKRTLIFLISVYAMVFTAAFILSRPNNMLEYSNAQIASYINKTLGANIVNEHMIIHHYRDDEGKFGWTDNYTVKMNRFDIDKLLSLHIVSNTSKPESKQQYYLGLIEFKGRQYESMTICFSKTEPYDVSVQLHQQRRSRY